MYLFSIIIVLYHYWRHSNLLKSKSEFDQGFRGRQGFHSLLMFFFRVRILSDASFRIHRRRCNSRGLARVSMVHRDTSPIDTSHVTSHARAIKLLWDKVKRRHPIGAAERYVRAYARARASLLFETPSFDFQNGMHVCGLNKGSIPLYQRDTIS